MGRVSHHSDAQVSSFSHWQIQKKLKITYKRYKLSIKLENFFVTFSWLLFFKVPTIPHLWATIIARKYSIISTFIISESIFMLYKDVCKMYLAKCLKHYVENHNLKSFEKRLKYFNFWKWQLFLETYCRRSFVLFNINWEFIRYINSVFFSKMAKRYLLVELSPLLQFFCLRISLCRKTAEGLETLVLPNFFRKR